MKRNAHLAQAISPSVPILVVSAILTYIAYGPILSFPFSYQMMPSPGSQSKPLSAFLILLACALYSRGRNT